MHSERKYLELGKFASRWDHTATLTAIKSDFGWLFNKCKMDELGLKLQVCVKPSRPMYLHGYLLTSALRAYLLKHRHAVTILETGTARGFSAIAMALILEQEDVSGTIHTIDMTPHATREYNNCLMAAQKRRPVSRVELLNEWALVTSKYINFLTGNSNDILKTFDLERIHFAFLDGAHDYQSLSNELRYVSRRQLSGDIIVCDDYTITQFPGICKAIDEFVDANPYSFTLYEGNDGTKVRGYVLLERR